MGWKCCKYSHTVFMFEFLKSNNKINVKKQPFIYGSNNLNLLKHSSEEVAVLSWLHFSKYKYMTPNISSFPVVTP